MLAIAALVASTALALENGVSSADDPWLWLERVDGINALAWVNGQNLRTAGEFDSLPMFKGLYRQALSVLDSKSRIPEVTQRGKWLYNLWRDADHPRGLYRRTTLEEFRKPQPHWQTVLDVDALSAREGTPWVFHGMECLPHEYRDCLVFLSPGGTDATEMREFDMDRMEFVEGGFHLPVAKLRVSWLDTDTLYVGTDFGPGSTSASGYPLVVKLWKRGTPLADARKLYQAAPSSMAAAGRSIRTSTGDIRLVTEQLDFWRQRHFQLVGGRLLPLELPETAVINGGFRGKLVISLKQDWTVGGKTFPEGSVVIAAPRALRGGRGGVSLVAACSTSEVVTSVSPTPQGLVVGMLDDVRGRLYRYQPAGRGWKRQPIVLPDNGAIKVSDVDEDSGNFFVEYQSFVTPPTLYFVDARHPVPEEMKAQAPTFDGSQFEVQQFWTVSHDGTRVPYFVVMKKGTPLDGQNPTHVFSYGGFRNSLTPSYSGSYEQLSGAYGKLWLERGGVFVLANIRGGGEFGPAWHRGAMRENHYKAFEDFEAVVRDLFARKITSPAHLGIEGRSNGGLLVLSLMTRHPELYGAIICGSPLADMRRYNELLAGASWMAEYGNPDNPADWAFISKYSPYQKLAPGRGYPPIFIYSSTRDDRVHPGHARKVAARMFSMGYHDVWYFENTEGGHHASSTHEQLAYRLAVAYTLLWEHLGRK